MGWGDVLVKSGSRMAGAGALAPEGAVPVVQSERSKMRGVTEARVCAVPTRACVRSVLKGAGAEAVGTAGGTCYRPAAARRPEPRPF